MQVLGIAIKGGKRAPMQEITEVKITESSGLEGDFRGRGGMMRKRQVTVLCVHQWRKACQELCVELPWHTRRANLFVDCPSFGPDIVGKEMYFHDEGALGTILEIIGETDPCKRMDEAHEGLRRVLTPDWRGGVTCRVVQGGVVRLGSWISFL